MTKLILMGCKAVLSSKGWIKYTQDKEKRKLCKRILFRVKIIDCQNDSMSVAWSFNKELYNRVSSKTELRVLFWE